jgi:hypothetical protein
VDSYEQLRRRVLAGDVSGWRLGMAVVQHRGVAAWLQVRHSMRPADNPPSRAAATSVVAGIADQFVAALAGMALCAATARS